MCMYLYFWLPIYKTFSLTRDPGNLVRTLSSKYFSPCFKILCVHTHVFYSNSIICHSIMHIWLNSGLQIRVRNWKFLFLFLNQNICCGYSKELSRWDGSFSEHPKHMFKHVDKKMIAILSSKILLNLGVHTHVFYSNSIICHSIMHICINYIISMKMVTLVLLKPGILYVSSLSLQCRFRSAGFWEALVRICSVFHAALVSTVFSEQMKSRNRIVSGKQKKNAPYYFSRTSVNLYSVALSHSSR